jgi:DNA-binding transcriptional ArsR family regulator
MLTDSLEQFQEDTHEQVALFSALVDSNRLKLVKLLCRQRYYDALCVNALANILGVTQSAVSQHLRVLKAIGLVKRER